jgi:predicted metal-dependent HD superfamily phosphohydrolase
MDGYEDMRKRWEKTWQKVKARAIPEEAFGKLRKAYSSSDRFYHNLTHIEDCLSLFDQTNFLAVHPEEVELAIWFHDVVYDTHRNDNEQKSAEWAESVILQSGLSHATAERVSHSILATRHIGEVTGADGQLTADVDLSILGRAEKTFWQYEQNIRKEYAWVPEELFRQKRIEILRVSWTARIFIIIKPIGRYSKKTHV